MKNLYTYLSFSGSFRCGCAAFCHVKNYCPLQRKQNLAMLLLISHHLTLCVLVPNNANQQIFVEHLECASISDEHEGDTKVTECAYDL